MNVSKKWLGLLAAVALAAGVVVLSNTHFAGAQNIIQNNTETSAIGLFVPVTNATDSLITDGCLVYTDSTTTGDRFFVKPVNATPRYRVLGIAAGDIQPSSKGGNGRVLIWGYHPKAWVAASNIGVNAPLKVSPSVYGRLALCDTMPNCVGYMQSLYSATPLTTANGASAVVYRAGVWFFGARATSAGL